MEEFLKQLKDKKVDIAFGTSATVRGDIVDVKNGILHILDEDKRVAYVSVEKIAVVWEADEYHTRPGFLG
ncbi:MAG: MM0924 family protein [Pyrinomonadaceae bacterium]